MKAREFKTGRVFLGRLSYDADLTKDILDFAQREGINMAVFSALGATKRVALAYYNQDSKVYQDLAFDKPMELISCWGNLSFREGKPHLHAHGVFADEKGHTIAGHIQPGTIVFAGEILLQELLGEPLHRQPDVQTGLTLWKI